MVMRRAIVLTTLAAGLVAAAIAGPAHAQQKPVAIEFWQGHFNRDGKAFHYWDKEKEIPAVCTRCHAVDGLPQYLKEGKTTAAAHVKNALACTTCHADMVTYARHTVAKVTFPSGIQVDSGDNDTSLCMTCHQGRESTASVTKALAGLPVDTPDAKLNFIHVHYLPAGATRYGSDAKVAFEYPGKTYAGRAPHTATLSTCAGCHEPHGGEVRVERCGGCHQGVAGKDDLANIRMGSAGDFDGNGREEGMGREVAAMERALYAAIQTYARNVGGTSIAFSKDAFPYWHTDTNGNGVIDADELKPTNKYTAYTPRLMQAVYNYTFAAREPGAAYHNGRYILQILHDSLASLAESGKAGVDMTGRVRPGAAPSAAPACAEAKPLPPAGAPGIAC
jgi:hypothetical protein